MANWMIQCADRYLGILYDYLHKELYRFHVLQADETPVMVSKDGRPANSKSYMWGLPHREDLQRYAHRPV